MEELNLAPQMANEKNFEGECGSYYSWSPSISPILSESKVGCGRLALQPRGFALPHYADCSKIGYVLQGNCTVGMVFPTSSEQKVLKIKEGDAIPVQIGVVSWWYNGGDTEVVIVFLGETTKAYISGQFTYFFMSGVLGMLGGFSTEFISKACNLKEDDADKLVKSQTGVLIVKLEDGIAVSQHCEDTNLFECSLSNVGIKNGVSLTTLTKAKLGDQIGLSAQIVKLEANAMVSPIYNTDSAVQITYVVKGSGRIQIVGLNGNRVLDTKVQTGHMFVVPKFFAVAEIADEQGMECFSVITSPEPVFGQLSGSTSVWTALSPEVLQASLDINQEFGQLFISNIKKSTNLTPPQN